MAALASKLGTPDAARAQLEAFNRKIPEEFSYMRYTPEVEAVVQGAKKTRDDKIAVAVQKASEDWRRYITSQTNSLNIAESPELAAQFEAERVAKADSIATLYGLDNDERNAVLGAPPQIRTRNLSDGQDLRRRLSATGRITVSRKTGGDTEAKAGIRRQAYCHRPRAPGKRNPENRFIRAAPSIL